MKRFINILIIVFFAAVNYSCGENSKKESKADCPIPPPEAIFKNQSPEISNHSFSLSGRNSEESLQFADGSSAIIFQSGCKKIEQEFRFTLPPLPEQSRVTLAVDRLEYMASLGPDYMTFNGWAQAISTLQNEFMLNSAVEVESGFFVGLDKLDNQERTTLIIKLFEQ